MADRENGAYTTIRISRENHERLLEITPKKKTLNDTVGVLLKEHKFLEVRF